MIQILGILRIPVEEVMIVSDAVTGFAVFFILIILSDMAGFAEGAIAVFLFLATLAVIVTVSLIILFMSLIVSKV